MNQIGNSNYQDGHIGTHDRGTNLAVDEEGIPILYEVVAPEHSFDQAEENGPGADLPDTTPEQVETLLQERVETAVDDALRHTVGQALEAAERRLRDDLRSEIHRILPQLISEVLHKRSGD